MIRPKCSLVWGFLWGVQLKNEAKCGEGWVMLFACKLQCLLRVTSRLLSKQRVTGPSPAAPTNKTVTYCNGSRNFGRPSQITPPRSLPRSFPLRRAGENGPRRLESALAAPAGALLTAPGRFLKLALPMGERSWETVDSNVRMAAANIAARYNIRTRTQIQHRSKQLEPVEWRPKRSYAGPPPFALSASGAGLKCSPAVSPYPSPRRANP